MTEKDRLHFRAIATAMRREKYEQRAAALVSTAEERVRLGFMLGSFPRSASVEAAIENDALNQVNLARKRPRHG